MRRLSTPRLTNPTTLLVVPEAVELVDPVSVLLPPVAPHPARASADTNAVIETVANRVADDSSARSTFTDVVFK